jgi:hypothetical protein
VTESTLRQIVHRAVKDGSFRAQLQRDPAKALAGFDLTTDERSAISSGDPKRLTALGVDQRMSKAFGTSVLGDASKSVATDVDGSFAGGSAFVDEASAGRILGGNAGGIVGDPIAAAGTSLIDAGDSATTLHMKLVEQDLDVGPAAIAQPSGEKYLTEDEALLAYHASLAASVGASVSSGGMAADGTSFDPGLISGDSGPASPSESDEAGGVSESLRRIEGDIDVTKATNTDMPQGIGPTEY